MAFLCTIFANIKILQHANVETFMVFRFSTPLIISVADYIFLGKRTAVTKILAMPSWTRRGAIIYIKNDAAFKLDAYMWAIAWFSVFSFDQIYIKHKVDTVKMTTWGRVYYTNAIACVPLLFSMTLSGEIGVLWTFAWNYKSIVWLLVSCFCGVAIAYFAFSRACGNITTYFTVVGNTCKILTIMINVWMWDNHATPSGMVGLFVCLAAAFFYKQAPKRKLLPK